MYAHNTYLRITNYTYMCTHCTFSTNYNYTLYNMDWLIYTTVYTIVYTTVYTTDLHLMCLSAFPWSLPIEVGFSLV